MKNIRATLLFGNGDRKRHPQVSVTGEDGVFRIRRRGKCVSRERALYLLRAKENKGYERVLEYPNRFKILKGHHSFEMFEPEIVRLKGRNLEKIDVGDVRVRLYYIRVELKISDFEGNPYFFNQERFGSHLLGIKTQDGTVVSHSGFSPNNIEKHYDEEKGVYRLELPIGSWAVFLDRDLDGNYQELGTIATTSFELTHKTKGPVKIHLIADSRYY